MTVIHKKQIVLGMLVVMVGVAGYLNWKYESNVESPSVVTVSDDKQEHEVVGEATFVSNTSDDYFLTCKDNRETVRSKAVELLKSIVDNPNSTQEAKDKAQSEMMRISKNIESEGNIENLIKAKGFSEAIVFINDNSITVTVRAKGLTAPETAKIKDIIIEETKNNNIKIVEVE